MAPPVSKNRTSSTNTCLSNSSVTKQNQNLFARRIRYACERVLELKTAQPLVPNILRTRTYISYLLLKNKPSLSLAVYSNKHLCCHCCHRVSEEYGISPAGTLWFRVSLTKLQGSCQPGLQSSQGLTGVGTLVQALPWLVAGLGSSLAVGQGPPYLPMGVTGCLSVPLTWQLASYTLSDPRQRERVHPRWKPQSFLQPNFKSDIPSRLQYFIHWKHVAKSIPHSKEENYTQTCAPQSEDHKGHLGGWLPQHPFIIHKSLLTPIRSRS